MAQLRASRKNKEETNALPSTRYVFFFYAVYGRTVESKKRKKIPIGPLFLFPLFFPFSRIFF